MIDPGVIKFYDNTLRVIKKFIIKAKKNNKPDEIKSLIQKLTKWKGYKKNFIKQGGFTYGRFWNDK